MKLGWLSDIHLDFLGADPSTARAFVTDLRAHEADACARAHPATSFLVLCGHTHGEGTYAPLDNVVVHTAAADYGAPRVRRVFEV